MAVVRRMLSVMAATAILVGLLAFWRRRHNDLAR